MVVTHTHTHTLVQHIYVVYDRQFYRFSQF